MFGLGGAAAAERRDCFMRPLGGATAAGVGRRRRRTYVVVR